MLGPKQAGPCPPPPRLAACSARQPRGPHNLPRVPAAGPARHTGGLPRCQRAQVAEGGTMRNAVVYLSRHSQIEIRVNPLRRSAAPVIRVLSFFFSRLCFSEARQSLPNLTWRSQPLLTLLPGRRPAGALLAARGGLDGVAGRRRARGGWRGGTGVVGAPRPTMMNEKQDKRDRMK